MGHPSITRIARPAAVFLAASLACASGGAALAQGSVPLIPRDVLFGNPERAGVQLSPDGTRITFLAPLDGVLNIWMAPADDPKNATALTDDDDRGIRQYFWMANASHIVYLQDRDGDENLRAYSLNTKTGDELILTPAEGIRAQVVHTSRDYPDELLIGLNDRDPAMHDVYRVDVRTGERQLVYENHDYAGFIVDDSFDIRLGAQMQPDGSMLYQTLDEETGEADDFLRVPFEDAQTTTIFGFDRDGDTMFWVDSRGRNTAALFKTDLNTNKVTKVFEDPKSDTAGAMIDPITSEIEAVASNYLRTKWTVLDDEMGADLNYLKSVHDGEINVTSRTLDDSRWIVAYADDNGPTQYVLYDRDGKRNATDLFVNRPDLVGLPLAPMHPVEITARDGLILPSYLSLPVWTDTDENARPDKPLPTILWVHGGPWGRDSWGFHPYHQWLTNRGYAVISVNFRASTGFGKEFLNAGNGEWADAMHTDLLDAVEWAVAEGIADRDKVGIAGGSYGGYATLAALTLSPEVFAAGASIVGPSNLITLLESIPPYWEPAIAMFAERVADHRTAEGRRKLRDMSPLTHVDEIVRPLLIGQGANDPRVKQPESDQIVHAMQQRGLPVTYVLFPDEGHGFRRPENSKAFNAVLEVFMGEHLGGRVEPIGSDVNESSALVMALGGLELPGVVETPFEYDPNAPVEKDGGIPEVGYEDLNDEQRMGVEQALEQIKAAPPEMLPMVLQQIEASVNMAPEDQKPAVQYLYHTVRKMIEANEGDAASE